MDSQQYPGRRRFLLAGMGGASALLASPQALGAANALTTFRSPALQPFVDELPRLTPSHAPSTLAMGERSHRFHKDLPLDRTLGLGEQTYLGPTIEAHRDDEVRITYVNQLCNHPFAKDIDTSIMGVSEMDRTYPRSIIHLHGGLTEPNSDGHPMATTRQGFARTHRYGNRQEAACLWYHDHALGLTRLNAFAGLAGVYLLRDDHDTGRANNALGLPTGEFELPLVLQDRIFSKADGRVQYRSATYVPQGQWDGGQVGDLPLVNGKVMPDCKVARGLYRLRLVNASNLRTYLLSFSNGMPFIVIGSDAGLFNAPRSSAQVMIAPGERYDVLVDFTALASGDQVVLRNDWRLPFQSRIFGDPVISQVMRFSLQSAKGLPARIPSSLRGGPGQAPRLPDLPPPIQVRNMTLWQLLDLKRFPPALMTLNNLPFDTTDIERPLAGSVEQWNIINLTTDEHPVHVHLARVKVIGRQPFNQLAYRLQNKRPALGVRWAPSADKYTTGAMESPKAWEAGFKDTVHAPTGMVTRLLVQWPSIKEMGFDPDAAIQVPDNLIAGAPAMPDKLAAMAGNSSSSISVATDTSPFNAICVANTGTNDGVMRLNPAIQDSARTVRGYVWHCHVLDHEDHDMMLPVRIRSR